MQKDLNQIKTEILSRLDIQAEYENLGIVFKGKPNRSGWVPCSSPYSPDKHPSCGVNISSGSYRGCLVVFNQNGNGVKPYLSYSFFDVAGDFLPGASGDFSYVIKHYANKTGVIFGSARERPTSHLVQNYAAAIPFDAIEYLKSKRGLSAESIKKYEIGFRAPDRRNSFPVYDQNGELVNIRYHNSKLKPKTLNHSGFGEARLWGADRLVKAPPASIICITEGEFDSMLLEQETGLISVSPTNGKSAFSRSWVPLFNGHHVVLVWDCDRPGRAAVEKTILPAFQESIISGKVLSLKVVWLYDNRDAPKEEKDFTDFIVKSGGTGAQLLEKIKATQPHKYSMAAIKDPLPDADIFFDGTTFVPAEVVDYMTDRYDMFHDGANFYVYSAPTGYYQRTADNTLAKEIKRALGRRAKQSYITDSLRMLEADVFMEPDSLKSATHLINMANGMLDIENGTFLPHDKKYFSTIQIPIKFDPAAQCPRWMRYLNEIFPEDPQKALALQEFAGYCFYPAIPFEKCLFLIGAGANGKSVFIKTLTKIVGMQNTSSLDPQVFAKDKFMLGTLKDKLLNVSSELDTREQLAANTFKKVISGDLIQADQKYRRGDFSFYPIAKHVFSMNEVPVVTDRSFAFRRRLLVLQFSQRFTGPRADCNLQYQLDGELSGIFNWALLGLDRIMSPAVDDNNKPLPHGGPRGFTESKLMRESKTLFMRQINPIFTFTEECCLMDDPDLYISKTDLYKTYTHWCENSGLRRLSRIRFYSQILSDFPTLHDAKLKGSDRVFYGIALNYEANV